MDQLVIPGFADNATRPLRLCLISTGRRSGWIDTPTIPQKSRMAYLSRFCT
jgi:hypothetical protein